MKIPFSGLFSRFSGNSETPAVRAARERVQQRSQPPVADPTLVDDDNWDFTSKFPSRPQGRPVSRESLSRPAGLTKSSVSNILLHDDDSFEPTGLKRFAPAIRSVILGVSMAVAWYVGGTYVEQEKFTAQTDELKGKISQLESSVKRLSGRVELPPDSQIVPVKTIRGTLEYVDLLKSRIAELETAQAPAATIKASAQQRSVSPENAQLASRVAELIRQTQGQIPTDATLTYVKHGEDIRVTYKDLYGYSRYFTANRADNQSRLEPKGLVAWANAQYVASLDVIAARQGVTVPQR